MPPDDQPPRRRVRVRMERPLTFSERIFQRLEMARLPRRQRNERIAIVTMVAIAVLYFLLRPILDMFFGLAPRQSSTPTPSAAPAKREKTDRPDRPDQRGPR